MAHLEVFVIYKQPRDYPSSFVLRRQVVTAAGITPDPLPLGLALVTETGALECLRALLPPGRVQIQRPGDDPDPCIYEVWL